MLPERPLGGMACPTKPKHIQYLQDQGVRLIVSLTQEPLSPDLFYDCPFIKNVHIPIANHSAPTYEDAAIFLEEVNSEIKKGNKVVVHCKHGKGRTGTMLATWLMHSEDMDAEQALKITDRQLHKKQKQFLYNFYEKQAENK
jgi:atypical dual specificity phosphatase